ncbi:MAG: cysteine hydrolase family protein [Promethearchaeota archaeon]
MKTVLLVIDAQKIYTNSDSELFCKDSKKTIAKINNLISKFVSLKLPIIFVRHIHKADGSDLGRMFDYLGEVVTEFDFKEGTEEVDYDPNLNRVKNSFEVVKNRYSAFKNTELLDLLKRLNIENIVICGFMTNFCCESTAREAHDMDYFVEFIVDATGTPGTDSFDQKEIRKMVGDSLKNGFAKVITTARYLKK